MVQQGGQMTTLAKQSTTARDTNFRDKFVKKTWHVEASLTYEYDIRYSTGIFSPKNPDLLDLGESKRRLVIFDKTVYDLYGSEARQFFEAMGIEALFCLIESTEERKDLENLNSILTHMEDFGLLRRSEPVIAVGGGVLLDIAGFAASIYRRSVPYIRVPTTLLALVDATVGAKTAINHFSRRNRLGSYYPPIVSYLDKNFIRTQSEREISNGLAEIFKLALIKDAELFHLIEENADALVDEKFQFGAVPVRVINRAITGMVEELTPDLWERNLERCVDFGHSFSPLIEMKALPELSHGEAVCIDCIFSCYIANKRGLLERNELDRIIATARRLRLPIYHQFFSNHDVVLAALTDTMKHRNGKQNLPLPFGIGSYVFCNDLTSEEIKSVCHIVKKELES
jgi:3-dehydroquinate synthetase